MSPLISVIMPVYNAEKYLHDAIDSVLKQSYENFEFIIINDGSTDGSANIIKSFLDDQRVVYVSRENRGLINTLNEGIQLAKGELIARMDADDISLSERFARQVAFLSEHKDVIVLGTKTILIDADSAQIGEFGQWCQHEEIDAALLQGRGAAIVHPSVMMRKQNLLEVGGYSEDFPAAEDIDLWLRLAEKGRIANVPEVYLYYRQHLESVGYKKRLQQLKSIQNAVEKAHIRRKVVYTGNEAPVNEINEPRPVEVFFKWAWWAYNRGNVSTARKYAVKCFMLRPYSPNIWKLLLFAVKGR